jgi:hypothetical protein
MTPTVSVTVIEASLCAYIGEGMTVLHTDSDMKAAEFMRNEPLIRRGLRRFDLMLWELREGTPSISTRLSQSRFRLG